MAQPMSAVTGARGLGEWEGIEFERVSRVRRRELHE